MFAALTLICFNASALEHVVKRGETLESIANHYNISLTQLKQANPGVDNLFFIGLKLNIPESQSEAVPTQGYSVQSNGLNEVNNTTVNNHGNSTGSEAVVNNDELSAEKFSCWYVSYTASVKKFDGGFYGLGWITYGKSGFGATFSANGNYGLVKPGNLMFQFGPLYGYPINENVLIGAQLKGFVSTYEGTNKKGYKDQKVGGGMFFMPNIALRAGKISLTVGYNLGWGKVGGPAEFAHSLHLAVGYDF